MVKRQAEGPHNSEGITCCKRASAEVAAVPLECATHSLSASRTRVRQNRTAGPLSPYGFEVRNPNHRVSLPHVDNCKLAWVQEFGEIGEVEREREKEEWKRGRERERERGREEENVLMGGGKMGGCGWL